MTVWRLHLDLTPHEESSIATRTHLMLPFEELPDLSRIHSQQTCRQFLMAFFPDAPPETIDRKADRLWRVLGELHKEDIIAVPLSLRQEVALAEVTGAYEYQMGDRGPLHLVPVRWHEKRVPLAAFKKLPGAMEADSEKMRPVTSEKARVLIRDRLPYAYNRFAGLKWLLGLFLLLHMVMMLMRLAK
jgi:hypothetical protein